jgi:polar amino acid transport system ATP-binding protein
VEDGDLSEACSFVVFSKVEKRFGNTIVLNDFNLEIRQFEKIALIGPSGSGKSTVLRILMTLEDIQAGTVAIDGRHLWRQEGERCTSPAKGELRRIRSTVGMVFQQFNLFPHMTALQNLIEAPIRVLGLSKEEAVERAMGLLTTVGLRDKAHSYPLHLSGGQQQRVAIARALAMRPQLVLLDEVTSALDPELVGEVLNTIKLMASQYELTIIMVTHQMGFARGFADRVCFMENGCIVEDGVPAEMFGDPKNARTKQFLSAVLSE